MATSSMQSPGASGIEGGFLTAREGSAAVHSRGATREATPGLGAVETLLVVCQGLKVRLDEGGPGGVR